MEAITWTEWGRQIRKGNQTLKYRNKAGWLPLLLFNDQHCINVEQGRFLADMKGGTTVITKLKEATGAEVTVELDEDLIGSCWHAFL